LILQFVARLFHSWRIGLAATANRQRCVANYFAFTLCWLPLTFVASGVSATNTGIGPTADFHPPGRLYDEPMKSQARCTADGRKLAAFREAPACKFQRFSA
jgi:hypothetical protein